MKWTWTILLCLVVSAPANAQAPPKAPDGPLAYRSVVFDPHLTMRTGAETVVTLQQSLARIEDQYLHNRWFSEDAALRKTAGIAARFGKLVLLDLPVDHFVVVLTHEYMGHGARYREAGIGNVDYGYDLPPPYGRGGGQASINLPAGRVSEDELVAMWEGGVESHQVLNRTLGLQWATSRQISYRGASLYLKSWMIAQSYIGGTRARLALGEPENDLHAYVRIINAQAGYTDPGHLRMTVDDLKSRARLNVVDPLLFASIYALGRTYLWDGRTSTELPMLRFGRVGYLPALRTGLTPFGLEYHLDNYLTCGRRAALVDVRVGDTTFHTGWGGLGVRIRNLYERARASFDANLDLWTQPGLELGGRPTGLAGKGFGGAASVRGYFALGRGNSVVSAVVELGYKSAGFLPGYPLDRSPLVTFGVAIEQ